MYRRNIRIDVTPGAEPKVIHVSQYDKNSRTYAAQLYASGAEFTVPEGATVAIIGTKPDGHGFDIPAALEGDTVTFSLHEQMTPVAGRVPCKLTIEKDGAELLTERFILSVDRTALDLDTIKSDSEIRQIAEIQGNFGEIIEAAESIRESAKTAEEAKTAAESASEAAETARKAAEKAAEEASAAKSRIDEADLDGKLEAITAAAAAGVDDVNAARTNAVETVGDKAQEVARMKVNAEAVATQALSKANNLENSFAEVEQKAIALQQAVARVQMLLDQKADDGYADSKGYLHLTSNGDDISDPIGPFATGGGGGGGGGGGSDDNVTFTARNVSGWNAKSIKTGSSCLAMIEWSSLEEEMETGRGTLQITVNGVPKATLEVNQGTVTVDVGPYVPTGDNSVLLRISDVYGHNKRFVLTVTAVDTSLSSSFDTSQRYEGPFQFPITPVGAVSKVISLYVDDNLLDTITTSVSGRQITFTIPQQSHGAHSIRCFFDCEINGQQVRSNELYFEFIAIEPLNNDTIITSNFTRTNAAQYEQLPVDFTVYCPTSETAEVALVKDGLTVATRTADRTQQGWALRFDTAGSHTFEIRSNGMVKAFSIEISETDIDVEPETDALALYLTAEGRSNTEAHPEEWKSGATAAVLTGFNFVRDGWQTVDDGSTVLRVSGDARVEIPYQIFGTDFRTSGKTVEIEFATRNVLDYNAVVLSCMSGDRGLQMTAQRADLKSEQSQLFTQYKEGEHIRLSFVVEKKSEDRLVLVYVNGAASGVVQYPQDDDFSQQTPVGISIGSNQCTIDIYNIRVYDNDLTRYQVLDNWIADAQSGAEMLDRFTHNNIYDEYGNVVIAKLPADLPYMVIECDELPQYKGDKKKVSGYYTDPLHPAKSFTFTGCQANVQGTSSAPYARKNYDMQFKAGFEMNDSGHADDYVLAEGVIAFNRFVLKADVASSESANNTRLVRIYNEACPYKVPEMATDPRVRWGIYGMPIALFWHDTVSDTVSLLGKYNFNLPKRAPAPYGYAV